MIGPVSRPYGAAVGLAEGLRPGPERTREISPGPPSGQEGETAEDAASPEARIEKSAVVQQAEALLEELRNAADSSRLRLRIEQNPDDGSFIYKSIDKESGEVVKEWPPEEVRRSLAFLDRLKGAFLDQAV